MTQQTYMRWTVTPVSAGGSVGASTTEPGTDAKTASKYTVGSSNVTVAMLEAFLDGNGSGTGPSNVKLGIYSDAAGSPDTLLVTSGEITIADGQEAKWYGATCTPTVLTALATYWFAVIGDNNNYLIYYTSGSAGDQQSNSDTYSDGFATPFGASSSGSFRLAIRGLVATSPVEQSMGISVLNERALRPLVRRTYQRRIQGMRPPAVVGAGIVHRPVLKQLVTTVDRSVRIATQRRSRTRWRLAPPPPRVITGLLREPPGIFRREGRGAGW